MRHVEIELVLAVVMVVLVIFAFLGSPRATVIASLAVPISLIGTCGAMYLLGYSLNNLSLMALTIATGFVVDDAIVMIENISRHLELAREREARAGASASAATSGQRDVAEPQSTREADAAAAEALRPETLSGAEAESLPKGRQRIVIEAALAGASEIGFTIISLTVSLIAVLIPLLFMGDVVGRLFREFAVTLAITILISAVVSLTLVPMMSARWLKPRDEAADENQHGLGARLRGYFARVVDRYDHALTWVIDHDKLTLLVALATLVLTVLLYLFIPKGLFPTQDTGQLQARVETADDVSYARMAELQQAAARAVLRGPGGRERQRVHRRRRRQQHDAAHRPHADRPEGRPRRPGRRDDAPAGSRAPGRRRDALPAADAGPDDRRRDRADRSTASRSRAPTPRR